MTTFFFYVRLLKNINLNKEITKSTIINIEVHKMCYHYYCCDYTEVRILLYVGQLYKIYFWNEYRFKQMYNIVQHITVYSRDSPILSRKINQDPEPLSRTL